MAMDGCLGGLRWRAYRRRLRQLEIMFTLALVVAVTLTTSALGAAPQARALGVDLRPTGAGHL